MIYRDVVRILATNILAITFTVIMLHGPLELAAACGAACSIGLPIYTFCALVGMVRRARMRRRIARWDDLAQAEASR